MQQLPLCLIQYMFDFLDNFSQIKFKNTCKKYHKRLYIKQLLNEKFNCIIPIDYYNKLNPQKIVAYSEFIIDLNKLGIHNRFDSRYNKHFGTHFNNVLKQNIYNTAKTITDSIVISNNCSYLYLYPKLNHMTNLKILHYIKGYGLHYLQKLKLNELHIHVKIPIYEPYDTIYIIPIYNIKPTKKEKLQTVLNALEHIPNIYFYDTTTYYYTLLKLGYKSCKNEKGNYIKIQN